jgi:uncharacterized protein (DUF427 family)
MTQTAQQQAVAAGHRVWAEPNERRVRGFTAGQAIADSSRTIYLFETGHLPIADYVAFYCDSADAWYEEDHKVFRHPRDPCHRVDVLQSSRHVQVRIGDDRCRQPPPAAAVRDRPPGSLLPAQARCAPGPAGPDADADSLPVQGRGGLLIGARRRGRLEDVAGATRRRSRRRRRSRTWWRSSTRRSTSWSTACCRSAPSPGGPDRESRAEAR